MQNLESIEAIVTKLQSEGKSTQEIIQMVRGIGLPEPLIKKILRKFKTPSQKTEEEFWDPAGLKTLQDSHNDHREKLEKKLQTFLENPRIPLRNLMLCALPGVLTLGLFILFPQTLTLLLTGDAGQAPFQLVLIAFAPVFIYGAYIKTLERDLVKILLAKEKNWQYNPHQSSVHWKRFKSIFPKIFNKGNTGQNLQDEFWGTFKGTPFYHGIFEYKIKTHSKKNSHTRTYYESIFAIKLEKRLTHDFRIVPYHFTRKLLNFFRHKEINTESFEFNKYYDVLYDGEKSVKALQIIKTLSPAVIDKLINLRKKRGHTWVAFKDEIVLFKFNGRLFKEMHTNFFKSIEVDPRDTKKLEQEMEDILHIAKEISKYLG